MRVVGYDITVDANNPLALCEDCGARCGAPEILTGDEWGGCKLKCDICGEDIAVVLVETRT